MKPLLNLVLLSTLLLGGCYKDEIDIASLNTNPFDRDYQGPAVFQLVGTYTEVVNINGVNALRQVVEFTVREDLFLQPTTYSVYVREQGAATGEFIAPEPPGSNIFRYKRAPQPGVQLCLELRLANNFTTAGAEVVCATL
jgi:hypothetical protein